MQILLLFFAHSLFQAMEGKPQNSKHQSYTLKLLYDPINIEKKSQKLQFVLLLIPILIFASSVIVNILIYFTYDEPYSETDDLSGLQ